MPYIDVKRFDRGTDTSTQQLAVNQRLPPLIEYPGGKRKRKKRFYGIFPYSSFMLVRCYAKIGGLLANSMFLSESKLLAGKHSNLDYDVSSRDIISNGFEYGRPANNDGLTASGHYDCPIIFDDVIVADWITLDLQYRKTATTVDIDICARLFYELVEMTESEFMRAFRS
jgi:hypothetical protein